MATRETAPEGDPEAPSPADAYRHGAGLRPQEWHDVATPPPAVAAAVAALLPAHGVDMCLRELGELVAAVADRPELWRPLAVRDPRRRRYRLMYEDHRVDVWALSWMPGQGTGFHDHDASRVGLAVADGIVVERQMLLPEGATRRELGAGDVRRGGPGYIHSVAWGAGSPAVSIHAYSPPLVRVGQYRVDADGVLERRVEHGRQELRDHTIGRADPSRADG
jgi:predicted metal-dependent enzyme (double-stranded beta helix superfamily)